MSDVKHHDLCGNPITAGCFVAYAASWGRSPILKFGLVTRLATRKEGYDDQANDVPTVRVITVDRNRWHSDVEFWELQKEGKEVALGFVDRMMVVDPATMPNEVRNLLRSDLHQRRIANLVIKALPGSKIALWEAPTGGACHFAREDRAYRVGLGSDDSWTLQETAGGAWTETAQTRTLVHDLQVVLDKEKAPKRRW